METKFKGAFYEVLICPSHVPELNRMEERGEGLLVGAAVSLAAMATKLREMVGRLPGGCVPLCRAERGTLH